MLRSHGRWTYAPITAGGGATAWPNGRGLAVYVALGVEEYVFGEGITENILAGVPQPDLVNTSWRDYGNRVGAFRLLDACSGLGIPLSVLLNTEVYDHAPALVEAFRKAGSAMIAHGRTNSDSLTGMPRAAERDYLAAVRRRMEDAGDRCAGWSSPWLVHTEATIDLLQETGYGYVLDFGMDDRPVWLDAAGGPFLHIPYAIELNDSSTIVGRQTTARDFADMIVDHFDALHAASREQPLVMSVVLHAFISGQPFRLTPIARALAHVAAHATDVWLTTPDAIHDAVAGDARLAVGGRRRS
jgi:hypothetical protein